ncbi:SDR family NAD(P)-dependent oxidoreductase [Promicromonospora sp. MEB111]|uniref:SDR family NAD(P)-dependent oxidoreductase n=1 Tax=Promicromonospora sp. MEB111 TaxID=3040301 RepID=UPI00254A9B40|nr:SDR family NAD(P)-dependent oxidoreductase [Promicromonospora sp. MEB111]
MTTAVITGATHGLGQLVALDLARQGLDLGIVARSAARADALRAEIAHVAPATVVDVFVADLSSVDEVRRLGRAVEARYDRIDALVNNAGLHAFSRRLTVDGLDEMTAVNYVAPWLLTNTLLDRLVASAPARVVTVASEAARHSGGIDPAHDLTLTAPYGRRASAARYGRTKLMDIMFSQELARRLAGTGVTANCCDPGFNTTGLGRELPFAGVLEKVLHRLRIGDPARGAGIITRLVTDPELATRTGGYFSVRDARPLRCPEPGRDADVQHELWEATERLLT